MQRLINADEVIKAFIGNRYGTKAIEYVIDNVPTVDAEPVRHGKWINDNGMYRCSVCNNLWAIAGAPEKWMYKEMKFCPNCGAKLDEVENVEID